MRIPRRSVFLWLMFLSFFTAALGINGKFAITIKNETGKNFYVSAKELGNVFELKSGSTKKFSLKLNEMACIDWDKTYVSGILISKVFISNKSYDLSQLYKFYSYRDNIAIFINWSKSFKDGRFIDLYTGKNQFLTPYKRWDDVAFEDIKELDTYYISIVLKNTIENSTIDTYGILKG